MEELEKGKYEFYPNEKVLERNDVVQFIHTRNSL